MVHLLSELKAASFGWNPEQEIQAPRQAALLLVPCDPLYLIVLEVSLADRDAVWRLWQAPIGESQCRPLRFCQEQSPAILCRLLSFWETAFDLLLGFGRDSTVNGPSSCHEIWVAHHELVVVWPTRAQSWMWTPALHYQVGVVYKRSGSNKALNAKLYGKCTKTHITLTPTLLLFSLPTHTYGLTGRPYKQLAE